MLLEYIIFLCLWIVVLVFSGLCFQTIFDCGVSMIWHEDRLVELLWTFFPSVAVVIFCCLNVGCSIDQGSCVSPTGVIKAIGHQWYWEISQKGGLPNGNAGAVHFDSLMTDFVNSVDKPILVNQGKVYQLLVTSADVIHSFSLPSLGVKMDACPGRLNSILLSVPHVGSYWGYCSELCGVGHAYMPIVVECVGY